MLTKRHSFRSFFAPPEGSTFSNRKLVQIFIPVLLEQLLLNLLGLVDTMLASALSDAATAGVSHGFIIYNVSSAIITGLAAGGSVVCAQWFGFRDLERASDAARSSLLVALAFAVVGGVIPILNPQGTVSLLMGEHDPEVLDYAATYLIYSSLSLPFVALISVCTATCRAQGNTRIPLIVSVCRLSLSLACKFVMNNVFSMGVLGTALSNLVGVGVVSIAAFLYITVKRMDISFRYGSRSFFDWKLIQRVVQIAVPAAIESASLQIGLLLVQRIITGFGVAESAAHGIASRIQPLSYLPAHCWGIVSMIVIGQCCGAGDQKLARQSVIHLMKLSYAWMIVVNIFCLLLTNSIVAFFGGSEQTLEISRRLFRLYCWNAFFTYTTAYMLPQALRGAGDVQYVMTVSLAVMFLARLGLAYLLGAVLKMGTFGVWVAMTIDWAIRTVFYMVRFLNGKWLRHNITR